MKSDIFPEYLKHFHRHLRPTKDHPVLLILDNHVSHLSLQGVRFCEENHICLLTIPPHSSHKMQPLDRTFFGPFKSHYNVACDNWIVNHPGRAITQYQVSALISTAYEKVASVENARKGFECTGIYPFNPSVFDESEFLPSTVTQTLEEGENLEVEQEDHSETESQCWNSEIKPPEKTNDQRTDQNVPPPSTKTNADTVDIDCEPSTSASAFTSPEMIRPFPRSRFPKVTKRKRMTAAVLTPMENTFAKVGARSTAAESSKRRALDSKSSDSVCKVCETVYQESVCDWFKCTTCSDWACESCFGTSTCFLCS